MLPVTAGMRTALSGPVPVVDFGVDLLDAADRVVEDISGEVLHMRVSHSLYAAVHRSCSLELTRDLVWGSDRVRPWISVDGHRWPLGVFVLTSPEQVAGEGPAVRVVDGMDKLWLLQRPVGDTYVVDAGVPVLDAVRQVLTDAGLGERDLENFATIRSPAPLGSATITTGVSFLGGTWSRANVTVANHGVRLALNDLASDIPDGQTMTASWEIGNPSSSDITVQVDWADIGGNTVVPAGGSVIITRTASRASYGAIYRFTDAALVGTGSFLFRRVLVVAGEVAPPWFNGDTAGASWSGTPNASTSLLPGWVVTEQATGPMVVLDGDRTDTTLDTPAVWVLGETGHTWLRVINDILGMVGYRGLWADHAGMFRSAPYMPPSLVGSEWVFDTTDPATVVEEDRTLSADVYAAPNWWRFVRRMDTEPTEGDGIYTVDRTNAAPAHRKVVFVDAADQAALEAQGDRTVTADTSSTRLVTITTSPLPFTHADTVDYRDPDLPVWAKCQVRSWDVDSDGHMNVELEVVS